MTTFAAILHLEHVDSAGGDAQTFNAATPHALDLAPDGTQFVACIDSSGLGPLRQAVLDGRTAKDPEPPADVTVTLRRRVSGADRLAPLDGRVFAGRAATLAAVGTGADGTVYTVADPLVYAAGTVVQYRRGLDHLTLTIRPSPDLFQREVPSRALSGYRDGLLFTGTSDEAASTYTTVPSAVTLLARVLTPHHWAVGAGVVQTVWGHRSIQAGYKLTNSYKLTLVTNHPSTAVSALHETVGPEFTPLEDFHWLSWRFDTAPAGGGVSVRFGIDGDFTTAANANGFHSFAGEVWKVGRYRATTDTLHTVAGAFAMFEAWLDDDELLSVMSRRIRNSETNLRLWYPGEVSAGSLLDYADVNSSSPLDATVTGATATSLLEGTEDLAGAILPEIIGEGRNVLATPVDPSRFIYRVASTDGAISALHDRGSPYEIETTHQSVRSFLETAPTATGKADVCPWLGGLVRLFSLTDGAEVAADIAGGSGWDMSVEAEFSSSGNPRLNFPTNWNLATAAGFALELWWGLHGTPAASSFTAFNSDTLVITYNTAQKTLAVSVKLTNSADHLLVVSDVYPSDVLFVRVDADNDGFGGSIARLTVNGAAVESSIDAGETLLTTGSSAPWLTMGLAAGVYCSALPMRLWSTPQTSSSSAAEDAARLYAWSHPAPSATGLIGLWTRHAGTLATVPDESSAGIGDATISNAKTYGHYGPGLAWSWRLAAAHYLLQKRGGLALASITDDGTAWSMLRGTLSWYAPERVPVADAVADVMRGGGGYVLIVADGSVVLGQIQEATAGNSAGTLSRSEVLSVGDEELTALPPSVVRVLWGRIGSAAVNALAGADDDRRALMAREVREEIEPVGTNATIYADQAPPDGRALEIDTHFRNREHALAEGERQATVWASERPEMTVELSGGHRSALPGTIRTITNPNTGAVSYVLVLSRASGMDHEAWRVR